MYENPIDRWLDAAVAPIRGKHSRQAIRAELQNHICDRVALLMRQRGFTEEEAVTHALSHMGDPSEIGKALAQARHPLRRFLFWLLTLLLWAAVAYLIVQVASCLL